MTMENNTTTDLMVSPLGLQTVDEDMMGNSTGSAIVDNLFFTDRSDMQFLENYWGLSQVAYTGWLGSFIDRPMTAENCTDDYLREYVNAGVMIDDLGIMGVILRERSLKEEMIRGFKALGEWSGSSRKVRGGLQGKLRRVTTHSWLDLKKVPLHQGYLKVLREMPALEAQLWRMNLAVELAGLEENLNHECHLAFAAFKAKYSDLADPSNGKVVLSPRPLTQEMAHDLADTKLAHRRLMNNRNRMAATKLASSVGADQLVEMQKEALRQYNFKKGHGTAMYLGTRLVRDEPLEKLPELALALHHGEWLPSVAELPLTLAQVDREIRHGLRPEEHAEQAEENAMYQRWHRVILGKCFGSSNAPLMGRVERVIELLERKSCSLNRLKGMRNLLKQMEKGNLLQSRCDAGYTEWLTFHKENKAEYQECKAIVAQVKQDWPKGESIVWQLQQRDNEPLTITSREADGVWTHWESLEQSHEAEFKAHRGPIVNAEYNMAWAPSVYTKFSKACSDRGIEQLFDTIQEMMRSLKDYAHRVWGNSEAGTVYEHQVLFVEQPLVVKEWLSLQWEQIREAAQEKRNSDSSKPQGLSPEDQEFNQASLDAMVDSVV